MVWVMQNLVSNMTSCEWCRRSENRIFEKGFAEELYQLLGWLSEVI